MPWILQGKLEDLTVEKKMCDTLFKQWMDGWMDGGQERRMRAWESDQNVFLAESEFHAHVG